MEKFDKNYIIGFILLFLMYGSYMYFYGTGQTPPINDPKTVSAPANRKAIATDSTIKGTTIISDTANNITEKTVTVENKDIIVEFTSEGGDLKKVSLKNYKSYDNYLAGKNEPMVIFDNKKSNINLQITTNKGLIDLKNLNFTSASQNLKIDAKKIAEIVFTSNYGAGKIEKTFRINGEGFGIDQDIKFVNLDSEILNQPANLIWSNQIMPSENDLIENRKASQINYYDNDESFTSIGLGSVGDSDEKPDLPVKWFSYKQKYFTAGIVSKNSFFTNTNFTLKTPVDNKSVVKDGLISAQISREDLLKGNAAFKMYFGPNDLKELKEISTGFNQNLYLGYDIVKPINRYVFVPLFNWVESFVSNYGLLIILVVLLIKITVTPLIYKSYISSAKMRLLAPEIAIIKEKVGDDAVKVQQETMKLYKEVGVSPLSGCVPLLLQMPILMSVFFLFPNMLMFRQKSFLWAKDLSTYDSPISWASDIPVIGHHISLFVVLMTISSLAFTYYNNQITPDQPGPIDMKKLSYIFPLVFFFVLNSFPAALSFYYLVSNLVTIAQQLIVRKFVDEDKIRKILENNKISYQSKPQKKSKFGDFIQKQLQASEELKKQSEEQKKSRKNK
jgi:YidC/Oxa1 family membrane protein insertase